MKQLKICHRKSLFFVKKDVVLYLGLLVFLDITLTYANISSHISKCCTAGTNYAKRLGHCNDHDNEVTEIPPLWHGLCLSALGLCCSREEESLHCIAGREAANMGSKCTGEGKYNTSAYTSCCKSCQIGLAVSAAGNNCSDAINAFLSKDESFTICCNHAHSVAIAETKTETDEEGTLFLANDEDICEKVEKTVGKLCEHFCENTRSSYVCRCHKGYQLNENGVTCSKIPTLGHEEQTTEELSEETDEEDEELLEENDMETSANCHPGFEKDKVTGKCKDIDECSKGTTSCLDHEYCSNTPGSYKCIFVKTSNCQRGYRFNTNTEECDDINECLEETDDCKRDDETCFNTRGSYTCQDRFLKKCQDGFIFSAETGKCEDYGLTDDSLGRSDLNGKVEKCSSGFRLKHGKCIDIDECATDKNACDNNQKCNNDIGGYRCECKIGFNMDTVTNACVDVNECVINNHKCLPSQRCDNTIGSYTCIRLQSCGTGYTLNSETGICEDDDECKLRLHTCSVGYECRNTKGSFRCDRKRTTATTKLTTTSTTPIPVTAASKINSSGRSYYPSYATNSQLQRPVPNYRLKPPYSNASETPCGLGFHRNHIGACVDINECQIPSTCGTHQRCLNTNGSYRCENLLKCRGGFKSSPDGVACIDIDECATGEHSCVNNQNCINRSGGFICTCPPGHKLDLNNRCVDINECEQEKPPVCPMTSTCMNTLGSFYCECKIGFKKHHANCVDVDECQEIPGLCQQECLNFWGGYRCSCNPGYELGSDNRTCTDIDECEVHKTYGLCMGICLNVPGSYVCSCPRGYKLSEDNRSCVDINECATGNFCTGRNDVCTNIRGSFRCTTIRCPYGYVNDADQKHRCRLANNICEGDECFSKPASYTYNFITLVSKLPILPEGRILFTLRGPSWYENIDFDLKVVRTQAAANIEKATENHFSTRKLGHQVELSLIRELEGPQDVELELSMNVFMNGQPKGKSVAKIFIIVSQYSF